METCSFEQHILNVLNKKLSDIGVYGEFYIVKSYRKGALNIQKKFLIELNFKNLDGCIPVYKAERTIAIPLLELQKGYDMMFEELLYHIIFNKELWNSISFKLR